MISKQIKPMANYHVLECAGVVTSLLGRMLVDLGATVYKILDDQNDSHKTKHSGYQDAFDCKKINVTQAALKSLLSKIDILIWDHTKLPIKEGGVQSFKMHHSSTIVVTLTPFGANGPLVNHPSSDLVNMAMSGYLNLTGLPGQTPIKPSIPNISFRHAALHALSGLLIALRVRRKTGKAKHVDVAIRDAGLWMLVNTYQFWDLGRINPVRRGSHYAIGDMSHSLPLVFKCIDGDVVWMPMAGRDASGAKALVKRMETEGKATDKLIDFKWSSFELRNQTEINEFLDPFKQFFKNKTRAELFDYAVADGILLAPIRSFSELLDDPQLAIRDNWVRHPTTQQWLPKAPVSISRIKWSL